MADALTRQEGGSHYKDLAIQPVEYIHANGLGFCEGSVVKYVTRWRSKNGIQDLKKARHFLDLLIELEERKEPPKAAAPLSGVVTPDAVSQLHASNANFAPGSGIPARNCQTCKHGEAPSDEDPCSYCAVPNDSLTRWEPRS